jgi:hypothetical protein
MRESCHPKAHGYPRFRHIKPKALAAMTSSATSHTHSFCIFPPAAGSKEVQVRLLARGDETVLGVAASNSEVFLTTVLETR